MFTLNNYFILFFLIQCTMIELKLSRCNCYAAKDVHQMSRFPSMRLPTPPLAQLKQPVSQHASVYATRLAAAPTMQLLIAL